MIHLIIKEISKFHVKTNVIPNGLGKCMAFTINKNFVFIDSMQFMNSGLDSLGKNLSHNDFGCLSEEFSGKCFRLVREKGVYPYEYMDSVKKFSENKLHDRSKFFSSLKDECISKKNYLKGNNIWNLFKMNTVGNYHGLYLQTNVLLLVGVFEGFFNTCFNCYRLDSCHYFSSPELSWDAMLKMTRIKLELISDIDMHLFIEKGMRVGISSITKKYSKANNKYMKSYDSSKESKYITYLDANNLYGWAMSRYLPYSRFKWLNQREINDFCLNSISENSSIGYILEFDLEYLVNCMTCIMIFH